VADMAVHHLSAHRAALERSVRRLVASDADPWEEMEAATVMERFTADRRRALKRHGRPPIDEIAGDEAEGSPASMPPQSGSGAVVGDH
jgi:hypothetical protein